MSYLRTINYYLREVLFQTVTNIFGKIWNHLSSWPLNKKEKILLPSHCRRLLACYASTFINRISAMHYWNQSYDFSCHCKIAKTCGATWDALTSKNNLNLLSLEEEWIQIAVISKENKIFLTASYFSIGNTSS